MDYMRQTRILQSGAYYHVVARANRQEFIFCSDETKNLILEIIARAKKKYPFRVKNFCIMGNHIHLMLKPEGDISLSKIMQWILSVFAVQFNKLHGLRGHVWYDRFRSKIIESFLQYLKTFKYITNNPVKAGAAKNAVDYPYNGVYHLRIRNYEVIDPPDQFFNLEIVSP